MVSSQAPDSPIFSSAGADRPAPGHYDPTMKLAIGVSLAMLIGTLGCDGEPKEKESITSTPKEPKTEPDKTEKKAIGKDAAETGLAARADAPKSTAVVSGSLRFVVIQPEVAVIRKRKKRVDSKQEIKQRERRKQRQDDRVDALQTALGAKYSVTRVAADEAERSFTAGMSMGVPSETALPAAWMTSESVLVLELASGTDRTERGGGGGFVRTGSSKIALFRPPATQPLYLEVAPEGLQVDTAEIQNIVEGTP